MLGEHILRLLAFGHLKVGPGTVVLSEGGDRSCFNFYSGYHIVLFYPHLPGSLLNED